MITLASIGIGFILVTLVSYFLLYRLLTNAIQQTPWSHQKKLAGRRVVLFAWIAWAIACSGAAWVGFTGRFDLFPLNAGPILLLPLATIIYLAFFSKNVGELLAYTKPEGLLWLQSFRVAVELLLWGLFVLHALPVQMTFEGRNYDVLSGLLGPLVAWIWGGRKWAVIAYNVIGLALLINIVGTALLSMPTPFRVFMEEPANTIVLNFPFIFLPSFLVPLAYGLHFLSLRQQLMKK